jgi:ectoine hydroxylase-related dioxygenase (phytanoyl-CoA dioxygenase family)
MNLAEFKERMDEKGWVIFDSVLDQDFVGRLLDDLEDAYHICRQYQVKNGIAADTDRTVHHLVEMGSSFMEYLEKLPLVEYMESYFQGKFILNSFGGAINTAHSASYAHRIHRDIRSFSGDLPLLLNTLVMLDEFTPHNGSTYLMTGSHRLGEKPSEEEFYAKAERALGKPGSILLFNSNVWHAGGNNQTDHVRRSLTPMFCKPFMKQQYDYPRRLGYELGETLSEPMRQILGYNARVPATLDEWYQPPEKRMYRPGQG